jgi:class 3 adenylate cyclase/tetratricopeptide (TPR) repeat protein
MLRPFCRLCRLALSSDAQFCSHCGIHLQSAPDPRHFVPQPSLGHTTTFSTPAPLPLPIEKSAPEVKPNSAVDGERKFVSIVFADISGFTAMSEKMDAEKITDLMNACFERLGRIVYESQGYIDKFMGDCIMALFGAPQAHENDPELAVRCALGFLDELQAFNQETGHALEMSIGINSGMVIAGSVGTEMKREYTVMGDAVNLAQRLQSSARPGQILVSRGIFKATESIFEFNLLPAIFVKGKEETVEIYEVLKKKKASVAPAKHFNLKRFIGRKKELELAEHCLQSLLENQGQIFAVSGEPGVGKSRLKLEVQRKAKDLGVGWYEAKCFILTRDSAYHSFRELTCELLRLEPNPSAKNAQDASERLRTFHLDPASEYLIRDLIGLPDSRLDPVMLDAQKKKKAFFMAMKKLLIEASHRERLILYFEDLHWMDALSLELLHFLMSLTQSNPVMIYASFRPDFSHDWASQSNFNQISLRPLQSEECLDLVRELLDIHTLPPALENIVLTRADGNPLYIEEIIKSLIESEDLQKTNTGWHLQDDLTPTEIPSTVQGLIASRIDKLDETEKIFLQYAAVIGREFSPELLDLALGGRPEIELILEKLKKRELIHERNLDTGKVVFIFKHALVQEVTYQGILRKKRRLYHERVALAIEHLTHALDRQAADEYVEMLAHHFLQAELSSKATHYLSLAGDKLKSSFNHKDAIKHYRVAIELIEATPHNSEIDPNLILKLYYDVAFLHMKTEPDTAEKYFRQILAHPQAAHDPVRKARVFRAMSEIAKDRGQIEEALQLQHHALEVSQKYGDKEGEIRTFKTMGNALALRRDSFDQAIEHLSRGLEGARQLKQPILVAEFLNDISILYIDRNLLDSAEAALQQVIESAQRENKLIPVLVNSTINMGVIHYYRANYRDALKCWEESTTLALKLGDLKNYMISRHNVGEILREFGKIPDALAAFQESYQMAIDLGYEPWQINNLVLIGFLLTKQGKEQEGLRILNEVLRRAHDKKYWAYYCDALFYLGIFYRDRQDYARSLEALQTGLAKAKELEMMQLVSRFEPIIEELRKESQMAEAKS